MQLLLPTAFSPLTERFPVWKNQVDAQRRTLLRVVQGACVDHPGALAVPAAPCHHSPQTKQRGGLFLFLQRVSRFMGHWHHIKSEFSHLQ